MGKKNLVDVNIVKSIKAQYDGDSIPDWQPDELRQPITVKPYTNTKWLKIKKATSKGNNYAYSRVLGGAGEQLIPTQNLKVISDPYDIQTRKEFTDLILTNPIAAPAHTYLIGSLFENGFTLELTVSSMFDALLGRYLSPEEISAKMILETPKYASFLAQLVTWKDKCKIEQLAKDLVSVAIPQGKAAGQIIPALMDLTPNQLPTFCEIIPADDLGNPIIDAGDSRKLVAVKINTNSNDEKNTDKKDILRADEIVYMTLGSRGLRRESKYQGVSRLESVLQVSLAIQKYYKLHAPIAMISSYKPTQLIKIKPESVDDATASRINTFMTTLFKSSTVAMAMPDWYDGVDIVANTVDWDFFSGIENKLATVILAQLGVPKSAMNREQDLNRDIATIQAIQFVRFTVKPLEETLMEVLENQLFNPLLSHLSGVPLEKLPVRVKIKRTDAEIGLDKMFDHLSQQKNDEITMGDLQQNQSKAFPEATARPVFNQPIGASGVELKLMEKRITDLSKTVEKTNISLVRKDLEIKERNVKAKEDLVNVVDKMSRKKK